MKHQFASVYIVAVCGWMRYEKQRRSPFLPLVVVFNDVN